METEYTTGALTQAISKKKSKTKKKKAAEEKKPLEDLFSAPPVAVTYVPCQVATAERKKKRKKSSVEGSETVPLHSQKEEESEGNPSKRVKHEEVDSSEDETVQVPRKKHMPPIPRDPNQEERTIFVGNLPNTIKMKKLEKLFKNYGEVESVRIRSVGVADPEMPRKLAVIRRDFHPERKNMNAYVRFKTAVEAEAALALNGQTYKGFCLRVDMANSEKQHDQKMSVFLGNLPFNIDENVIHSYFEDCGEIEGVRLIRDSRTGIGKGIGYVQFQKAEAIELALNLDGGQLGGRKIRVSRSLKKPVVKKIGKAVDKSKRPKHHRNKEELPPGANRKTRMEFFSQLKKTNKPVPQRALKRKAARRIANGKKNRKITDKKINNGK